MSERRFTEKEASEIVRRAVEAQSRLPREGTGEGIGEQELRSAARELGIDDASFDQAVEASEQGPYPVRPGFMGGPFQHETEVILDGVVEDSTWEEIVSEIRRSYGESGKVDKRGTAYEWLGTAGGLANTTLTITRVRDSARLRVTSTLEGVAYIPYLLAILPALFIGVALVSKLAFPAVVLLPFLFCLALLARQVTVVWSQSHRKKTASLVSKIRKLVTQPSSGLRENLERGAAAHGDDLDAQQSVKQFD